MRGLGYLRQGQIKASRVFIRLGAIALVLVALTLVVLGTGDDPGTLLSIFTTRFLGIFIEAAPFLLIGTLTSGLIEAFVSREAMTRLVPRNRALATATGALMGFAFPVCECGVVPVVRRLFNKGLPMSVGITFLLAAPIMNPIVLASTFTAFGFGPILIGRIVIAVVVAISVGLVFATNARPDEVLQPQSLTPTLIASPRALGSDVLQHTAPPQSGRRPFWIGIREALQLAGGEFFEMGRYLIIGSMLAAGMQSLVSQEVLLSLGRGPVTSVITMQVLAFVLSVCSTVDAFLALAFAGTFTTGSVLAFLTFGPMVDVKSTLMFLGVFKRKVVLYLILLPMLMTMLIAIWTNLNLAL